MNPNKWVTITDHFDSCGAFDLVQRQYFHDIKPAAQYGMHSIRMFCLESTIDWYRDLNEYESLLSSLSLQEEAASAPQIHDMSRSLEDPSTSSEVQ